MKRIILVIACLIMYETLFAQETDLHSEKFNVLIGQLKTIDGIGKKGVLVGLKNKAVTTITDDLGNFKLYGSEKDSLIIYLENYHPLTFSLEHLPTQIDSINFNLTLIYKNITNVSDESITKMSVNSFLFPPLKGYSSRVLSKSVFEKCKTLGDINKTILQTLDYLGYDEVSYFIIPNGFALVTRIEEIEEDGSSVMNSERFSINESKCIKFSDFFTPRKGHFRLFAFLITDIPFRPNKTDININNALNWSTIGYNVLPNNIKGKTYSDKYNCSVLVYEFKSEKPNSPLIIQKPVLSAEEHLKRSKIWSTISNN